MKKEAYILLAGVCGAAAGFFAGWKLCDKKLRGSYAAMAASDISDMEKDMSGLCEELASLKAKTVETMAGIISNGATQIDSYEDVVKEYRNNNIKTTMETTDLVEYDKRLAEQADHNADVNLASGASAALRGAAWGDVFLDGREDAFPYPQTEEWYTVDFGTEDYPHYVSGIKSRYTQSAINDKMYPAPYIYDPEEYFAWVKEHGPDGIVTLPGVALSSILWEEEYDVYLDEVDFAKPENSGDIIMTRTVDGEEEAVDKEEVECLLGTNAAAKFASYVKEHMLPTDAYFELCLVNEGMARVLILSVYMEGGSEYLEG